MLDREGAGRRTLASGNYPRETGAPSIQVESPELRFQPDSSELAEVFLHGRL